MKQSENYKSLFEAILKAQSEFETLPKDKQGFGYKYTDFDTVITYVRPILQKYGIGFMQSLTTIDGKNGVTTRLFNAAGEWLEDTSILPDVQLKGTNTAQNMGAAITYTKRYALCAILGISSDEDTDAVIGKSAPVETPKPVKDALKFKFKGGDDTPEEHEKIKSLLATKDKDGNFIFKNESEKVVGWRHERTAAEVIDYLEKEKEKRLNEFKEDIPWDNTPKESEGSQEEMIF
jgi:hypothetical protein